MAQNVPLTVGIAILSSVVIVRVMVETGLNRTVFSIMPSLAIVVLVWMAYPPAQQLPPIVSIAFWGLITYVLYHFPPSPADADSMEADPMSEADVLDQFFKETPTR